MIGKTQYISSGWRHEEADSQRCYRNNYAAARLQGLEEDLHLRGDQYQVGLSILFVAYILMQVPSNLVLNYIGRPSLYLGGFTVAWGLVSCLTYKVKTYGDIVACRFILGLVGEHVYVKDHE